MYGFHVNINSIGMGSSSPLQDRFVNFGDSFLTFAPLDSMAASVNSEKSCDLDIEKFNTNILKWLNLQWRGECLYIHSIAWFTKYSKGKLWTISITITQYQFD